MRVSGTSKQIFLKRYLSALAAKASAILQSCNLLGFNPQKTQFRAAYLQLPLCAAVAFLVVQPAAAKDVQIEIQGLTANGNLEIAEGKSLKSDGAVLLIHEELSHNRMEVISALQELLYERGVNSLAITLTLGLNDRRGLFDCGIEQDHRNEDAIVEIRSWINWLKSQGARSVTLAGHARGGNQVAIYAAKSPDKVVKRLVLVAPTADTEAGMEGEYGNRFGQPLGPILAEAEKLVAEDRASDLLSDVPFLVCRNGLVTAAAFVNYYGSNQNLYTPSVLPHISMPILVAIGDLDPLANEVLPAIEGMPGGNHIQLRTITGADHFFRDLAADELADVIQRFLAKR